ncbi:MAG: hypothetical protein OK455_10365 [Thaumarchaeota archaeon]|nr:hypothetical protein [Nitrososphaerota archaeon]
MAVSIVALVASATPATVTTKNLQTKYGILTYVYFETVSATSSSTPGTNTAFTQSGSTGSYTVLLGSSVNLWSPQFSSAATLSAGTVELDLWGSAVSGTLTVSIYATDSTGTIRGTIVSGGSTASFGLTKGQLVTRFAGAQVSVPANGYVEAVLTGAGLSVITIYWGAAQESNFQVPYRVLS